ncbi:MAG: chaperone NapD [Alphaproteobacteria bacterium]|nr:chaperone NapD [Alphaproteobacteria bacterium]
MTSLLVRAHPGRADELAGTLRTIAEVDVHTTDPGGKLVLVVETQSLGRVTDLIEQINVMDGVVSTTLVYHQIEDSAVLDQPVDASDPRADSAQLKEPAA